MATDITQYSFPKDDFEAWNRYPKLRWVYETSRLLESQNIKWTPYKTKDNIAFIATTSLKKLPMSYIKNEKYPDRSMCKGDIFINPPNGDHLYTDVIIQDGHIKYTLHSDVNYNVMDEEVGNVILRISAFVALFMRKFSGIVSFETYGSNVYALRLKPTNLLLGQYSNDALRILKRIFKKVKESSPEHTEV